MYGSQTFIFLVFCVHKNAELNDMFLCITGLHVQAILKRSEHEVHTLEIQTFFSSLTSQQNAALMSMSMSIINLYSSSPRKPLMR